jgi:phage terminase large subunit GpA-like protein
MPSSASFASGAWPAGSISSKATRRRTRRARESPIRTTANAAAAQRRAQGDVPVLLLNPTILKDTLDNRLEVAVPGYGMIHFPDWLCDWFYQELVAEQRDPKKGWLKVKPRNEAWDLLYYAIGGCVSGVST